MAELGLAEVLEGLRAELLDAIGRGQGAWMRFGLAPIEVTLQVVVKAEGSGKVGWKVLEVGGKYEKATTQTVKLTLTPTWECPDGSLTTDFTIAGDVPAGATVGPTPPAP